MPGVLGSMQSLTIPFASNIAPDLSDEAKERTAADAGPLTAACTSTLGDEDVSFTLQVRWWSESNSRTKVNRMNLSHIRSASSLQGICQSLVNRAFPEQSRPDYMTSPDYYCFTPDDEFLSTPGVIARTEFKFNLYYGGWEYCVLHRELGAHRDPERNMFVTAIEFESQAMMIGTLGLTVSLISYPLVFIKKSFLDDVLHKLQHDPGFKGILN